ncbi:hypothetical protein GALL_211200 [mine drainage metagenome]|uniref:Uncharacterized protein n=1 Tax=mine drainage metagenome TaxID=410659 RepID=A0A1J5S579_9ZZZZ
MKPVRRRIRRHFGLTAKQVAVRSQRPWYFQWVIVAVLVLVGYSIAYWKFEAGSEKLKQAVSDSQSLQSKVIIVERQLQIEQAAQANLEKELNVVQDENLHLKEDLLFYKGMVSGKRRSR